MNLYLRPVKLRLAVAYMATARHPELFPKCSPGNTLERYSSMFTENGDHPYSLIWGRVSEFYEREGLDQLCDAEIADRAQAAMAVGYTDKRGTKVPAADVQKAVQTWANNGWFRYEQRRDSRRKTTFKYLPWAVLAIGTGGATLFAPPS